MNVLTLLKGVAGDLKRVESRIADEVASNIGMLDEMAKHPLHAGGKRLRPAMVLLSAKPYDYNVDRLLAVAAAIELMHMATLVHDDVIDSACLRRGHPTVNSHWGDKLSVLTGDYLFARAVSMVSADYENRLIKILADGIAEICEGEIQQTADTFRLSVHEDEYINRISKKTACFFRISCEVGGLLSGAPAEAVEALRQYGQKTGIAFQIADDILDIMGTSGVTGKPVGSDLQGGVITLPVIHVLNNGTGPELKQLIRKGPDGSLNNDHVAAALDLVKEGGGVSYALEKARSFADEAIEGLRVLPDGMAKETLVDLANFFVDRDH